MIDNSSTLIQDECKLVIEHLLETTDKISREDILIKLVCCYHYTVIDAACCLLWIEKIIHSLPTNEFVHKNNLYDFDKKSFPNKEQNMKNLIEKLKNLKDENYPKDIIVALVNKIYK